jgi:tetratricopeptide (TPR) repeat protein
MRPDRIKSVSCIYKQNNEIMGLGFTIHTKIKDIEKFQQAVESQAVESGYNAEHDESSSTVSFCRLGDLFLNYQHEGEGNADNVISVNGDCQTNMLGPGFHKAAIEFIDRLQQATGTRFEVEDETDYYTERDFEAMKKKHFHKWLAKLFEIIQEQEDKGSTSLSICWDLNKYYPQSDSGIVISPLGSFRLSEVIRRIREEGIESFADDFFIWNNPERDARFHRGLALNAMWEDCYFMPSERSEEDARINGYIISELETAASLDPSLPFPKKEYEELCRLHGCTPVPTDGIPTYETEFAIGYRRGIVNHKVGRIRFSLPGSYLEDTDDGTLVYYDAAADNWHTVRCTGYSTNGDPDFLDVEEEMIEEREFDGGKYRLYDMGTGQDSEDEEPYPVYSCHALCSNQYTLFTLCASRLEDLKKLSSEFLPTLVADQPIEPENKQIIYTGENMNDELMKQIDEWHKAEKHQEIIDALEQIPEAERDFETTSLLARAYNNIEEYAKAAELLESIKEEGAEDERWNFRMGYAQYFLNNYREALGYFSKARELNPEDEDTLSFIRQCNMHLPLTRRVKEFWNWFVENEEKLSGMMNPKSMEEPDAFMEFISKGTNLISEDMHFNIGGDHEFTFSVEGWPDLFIIYPYIISCMPECLKGKWKFFPFNPGKVGSFAYRVHDTDVDMGKIMVKASYDEKRENFNIRYYDKNLCALPEENSDGNFHVILELVLGEGVSFKYVNGIERASGIEEGMIALSGLRQHIEETVKSHGHEFFENPKDVYTGYQLTPKESDELRFDVIVGSTCLYSLVADYYNDSTDIFDHANSFGAQAMFLVFPNSTEGDDHQILDFRHDLEDRITEELLEPGNLGVITGGATGTEYSYIDLFVYNLRAFVKKVIPLLDEYPEYSFYISDFIRNGRIHQLTEAASEAIPYTKENKEEFLAQIEKWNDMEKFSKCIKALEDIPEAEQDYDMVMLLVRAYENYAILGDNGEEPEDDEKERALNKALELLESIREAGESQAGWNKRMAYAYQYLVEQEEKAIEYAKRWAELDPEDNSAVAVINECNEELEKRKIKCESCCDDDNGDNKSIAPEMYSEDEIDIIEKHIEHYYGNFEFVFHEKVSPDIHVDICLIPPSEECNWYTLVTMGMGAHLMNVPNQLKEDQLERAELVICLPEYWKLDKEHLKDEKWYWPIRLLKELARFPGENNTWLGWGHTVSYDGPLSYTTELCASILINPPCGNVGGNTCTLPDGEEVNFYQVTPLYGDELEYKLKNGTQKLLDKMNDNILLVNPHRLNVLNQIDIETNPIQSSEISISSVARQEVIAHIEKYFGKINNFLHDDSCSEYPLDIAVIAPRKEHNYYTLITANMSNHEVLESDDIDGNTCHQELLINLPPDWKLGLSDWTEEKWCWPIRLITSLARQCIRHRTCISWGKTMELGGENTFSEDTKLCAIVLLSPSIFGDKSSTCKTQGAGSVEFYQVIPLYREELQFIQDKDIDEFFEICPDDALETINPLRLNVVTDAEKIGYDISYIDDAKKHEEKIEELHLSADELAPYNHMAIYLRWCIEHNLMSQPFLFRHGNLVDRVKAEDSIDLREFIRDNEDLHGGLSTILLNRVGTMFTKWYNWENRSTPYAYIKDIQAYAMDYFKGRIWNSEDETDAAYLLLPWTEKYYHDMAALIDDRFKEWEDEPQTDPQFLHIPQDNIKLLLKDWSKAIECTVSSRVLVDGCEIATCIRQKPFAEDMGWDSGWLFLADGDEDNDECRYEYCDLNTICNYSPDVMQYLDFPYDTRLVRKEDGNLYVDEE